MWGRGPALYKHNDRHILGPISANFLNKTKTISDQLMSSLGIGLAD